MLFNLNSNNAAVNVTEDVRGSDTSASVNVTTASGVALAANPSRTSYSIYNAGNATIYIRENSTVSTAAYKTPIPPGFMWKEDFAGGSRYGGIISVVGAAASVAMVSESSAP
jgi:hypothetical protein